ncbi:MAG TPA: glycosyltransferase family 1 protein [Gaiella sp.]|jgi:glycosyltransferase involved in cell wall biosynthesis|nr:glycosyltransferase family 1 protein [Gaiella sp.]
MRVGIDTSPLVQTRAGTARHVIGLLGELADRPDLELVGLGAGGTGRLATVRRDALWYPFRLGHASARLDVLHCTTFRAPVAPRAPLVVTVHDLGVLRRPGAFPRWHRITGALALRSGVRAADAVVAVSAFTRDELVELLHVPVERIRIVPNGVDPVFFPDGPSAEGDYVLAVGTLEPRKNLAAAVEAARLAGVELRVAGASGWGGVAAAGWVGEPTDQELAALMRGARCLVYPSLYEGFGLPVLEAMACGTPVVTSRGGATEEVAGGAAVLADPRSPASIADGIGEATRRRAELREIGLHRAAMFTWRRSADIVEALWRQLV